MLKPAVVLWGILMCFCVSAQTTPEKYAATITAQDLKKHLTVIAGAEMEGRETATPGQKKAAEYIENYFSAIKLTPANDGCYLQEFPLMEDSMVRSTVKIDGVLYTYGKDYLMSARQNKTYMGIAGSVIFGGYGISDSIYNDYEKIDIKNSFVVISAGEPKSIKRGSWFLGRKVREAYKRGAVGVFVIPASTFVINSATAREQRFTGAYFPHVKMEESPISNYAFLSRNVFQQLFGTAKAKSLLKKMDSADFFTAGDYERVEKNIEFEYAQETYVKARSSNVLGFIEGADKKDEYVILTAHYDHLGKKDNIVYYGADDDGSGTVSVLEMAEAFTKAKSEGNGPRRTIVFMAVSGEEKGLWGSEYYSDHPVFPLDKTTVNLNTDMVGRIDPKRRYGDSNNYIYVIGDDKVSSELKLISETANNKYTHLELDYKYNEPADPERIFYRSDHYNFARKGVPILFYFNGTHADYHRPTDTVDKINFSLMEKRVHLIFYTAWEMANRDEMLKRDVPLR